MNNFSHNSDVNVIICALKKQLTENNTLNIQIKNLCQELEKQKEKVKYLEGLLHKPKEEFENGDCLFENVIQENEKLENQVIGQINLSPNLCGMYFEKDFYKRELENCQKTKKQSDNKCGYSSQQRDGKSLNENIEKYHAENVEKLCKELENTRKDKEYLEERLAESERYNSMLRQDLTKLRCEYDGYKQRVGIIKEYTMNINVKPDNACCPRVENTADWAESRIMHLRPGKRSLQKDSIDCNIKVKPNLNSCRRVEKTNHCSQRRNMHLRPQKSLQKNSDDCYKTLIRNNNLRKTGDCPIPNYGEILKKFHKQACPITGVNTRSFPQPRSNCRTVAIYNTHVCKEILTQNFANIFGKKEDLQNQNYSRSFEITKPTTFPRGQKTYSSLQLKDNWPTIHYSTKSTNVFSSLLQQHFAHCCYFRKKEPFNRDIDISEMMSPNCTMTQDTRFFPLPDGYNRSINVSSQFSSEYSLIRNLCQLKDMEKTYTWTAVPNESTSKKHYTSLESIISSENRICQYRKSAKASKTSQESRKGAGSKTCSDRK